ncbi:uncharacterized protein LOC111702989 [Eurytemora carolleeae]|uniref:uncharacterized protein LOC111702989 n=1 Tax=Eurytemora carolleeae TaxID=1294199 RepID=UPI000C7581D0|nr:uncharacterized protein LOC111702989 [Eurytemora carolleeae]|eukprot:XP_023330591.1 uncharacterized protein LOC111702989 [Eurytemora affinis]
MCIKGLDVDSVISGYIYYEGYWERDMLQLMLKILQAYPNATLLDVGSNIGMFSVTAAAANYSVVAVDPFKTNLAYIRLSTVLHGSQDNVRYIPHTIRVIHIILEYLQGATPFVTADVARTKPSEEIGEGVESITFNELLDVVHTDTVIVKMDIQGAECKALIPFLQKKIKTKYIPYIIMEWQWITYNMMGLCPDIQPLIKAFLDNGYFPANVTTRHELDIETQKTWYDVLWVHQDAIH